MMTPEQLLETLAEADSRQYGDEDVSQLEHALQCAALADVEDGRPAMIIAALLHDVGHLVHKSDLSLIRRGTDDRHELMGGRLLEWWFGPAVAVPVRLHVAAKRYLCRAEPGYWDLLSVVSKASLEIQGGPFTLEEAAAFSQLPYAIEAVRLRRWDERAKIADLVVPPLANYRDLIAEMLAPDEPAMVAMA